MVSNQTESSLKTKIRVGDLEIDENVAYQRWSWRLQRVAWAVALVVLIGGGAGLFGRGPLSERSVSSADGLLSVEYERFGRNQAPLEMNVYVSAGATNGDTLPLWINRQYLDTSTIETMIPQPLRSELAGDRLIWRFPVEKDDRPHQVSLKLLPEQVGTTTCRLGLVGGPQVRFDQFIYP